MPDNPRLQSAAPSLLKLDGATVLTWIIPVFLLLTALGVFVLRLESSMPLGNQMPADRAIFTAANAITLTGFQQTIPVDKYKMPAQICVLTLTLAGSFLTLAAGGLAVTKIVRLPYTVRHVLIAALCAEAAAILLGTAGIYDIDRTLFEAVFQSASAFGNSGLVIGRIPGPMSLLTHLGLMPLALAGGLGLPVLMELFDRAIGRRSLSDYSLMMLKLSAIAYLVGFAALVLIQLADLPISSFKWESISHIIANSSLLSIDSRTAGLPLGLSSGLPRAVEWITIILMAIGACPGGTAGGIKLTSIREIGCGVRQCLSGKSVGRAFAIAIVWLSAYAAIVFVSLILMLRTDPETPGDRLLFNAVSAFSNVGLSHEEISAGAHTLYVLTATMLLGRIAPMVVLWWMADTTSDAQFPIG